MVKRGIKIHGVNLISELSGSRGCWNSFLYAIGRRIPVYDFAFKTILNYTKTIWNKKYRPEIKNYHRYAYTSKITIITI